jgi:hypothetical protein
VDLNKYNVKILLPALITMAPHSFADPVTRIKLGSPLHSLF